MNYYNGDKYNGFWEGGKRKGFGKFYFANGDYFEGNFEDNEIMGRGLMIKQSGD